MHCCSVHFLSLLFVVCDVGCFLLNMLLFLCLLIGVNSAPTANRQISVETKKGVIIGTMHDGYNSFLGVPYSFINVTDRFGPGLEYPPFSTPFEARNSSIICAQIKKTSYKGRYQCLTINIYTPQTKRIRLPVLVWFHGESFWTGNANDYSSPYLVKHEIIFISVNFRLGPYGFLCPKEYTLPGNQALRDQRAALRWIQKHIEAFNGDPNSVTIAGSGYGGSYVDIHLYSNLHERLFDKVIIQSGSIFSHGFFVPPNPRYPIAMAKILHQNTHRGMKARDVIPFLSMQKPSKIIRAAMTLDNVLGVCTETKAKKGIKNIVSISPFDLDLRGKVTHTKILVGYNSMEMLGTYAKTNTPKFYKETADPIYKVLAKSFDLDDEKLTTLVTIIKKFYFGDKDYSPSTLVNLAEAMSDFFVNNGVERSVNRFVRGGATVYKYVFSYTGASQYSSVPGAGATQGEELKFLFDWRQPISGTEQEMLRTHMVQMWADFVKFGNPTPVDKPLAWRPLHGLSRPYLNIDTNFTMLENAFQHRNAFWHLLSYSFQGNSVLYA